MPRTPVIVLFDIGKTNKKVLAFDEQYNPVLEQTVQLKETTDEDGDPCEDLQLLQQWVGDAMEEIFSKAALEVKAVNFATYGASFVYIDEMGKPLTPLYNYLKPYPESLKEQFYAAWGGEEAFAVRTASPVLGSLNSGMQLYRLKKEQPQIFAQTKCALHLPQYLSFLLSGHPCSDITSVGCHTNLWDFEKQAYHTWVQREKIAEKLAPLEPCSTVAPLRRAGKTVNVGIGLHDSSAALVPYLRQFQEPFVLLSTGTWCISFHPFNQQPLTAAELRSDCLCYLTYQGRPVKASRFFAGYEHEQQVARIAAHFNVHPHFFKKTHFDAELYNQLMQQAGTTEFAGEVPLFKKTGFEQRDLFLFSSAAEAYHQLILDLVQLQTAYTELVLRGSPVKRLFVDGGFSKNNLYMQALAAAFPHMEVYAATAAKATALGAALVVHPQWNKMTLPSGLIEIQRFHCPVKPTVS